MIPPLLQSFGGAGSRPAFALGFADLGAGVVDTSSQGSPSTPTFTRATAAATKLSTGLWKLDVASGSPRSMYLGMTTAVGAYGGYLAEGAATQLALNPRDMTQAAWVAVTMTTAQTSTGIDGVANSCTRITASGANSTILQTLVAAATSRTYSCWVKRVTGTGTIILKQGTATLDITALINSSTFTLVQLNDNELNVAYGLQINTSGDALDVDCNQFEAGTFATTPIPAAGTRNADSLTYPIAANIVSQSTGTLYAEITPVMGVALANRSFLSLDDGTDNERIFFSIASSDDKASFSVVDGGVSQASLTSGVAITANTVTKIAGAYALNDFSLSAAGNAVSTDTSGTLPTTTTIVVGRRSVGSAAYGGIKNVKIWILRLSDGQLQALTA